MGTTLTLADWAFGRPGGKALKDAGFSGVIRYLSNDPKKNLDSAEVEDYLAHGLTIHVVWESAQMRPLDGASGGIADAEVAFNQLVSLGWDGLSGVIYFATDFDTTATVPLAIRNYYAGIADEIGAERAGAYGGQVLIQRVYDDQSVSRRWRASATSWNHVPAKGNVDIEQTIRQATVNGVTVDVDFITGDSAPVFGGPKMADTFDYDKMAAAVEAKIFADFMAAAPKGKKFKESNLGGALASIYRQSGDNVNGVRSLSTVLGMVWTMVKGNVPADAVLATGKSEVAHIAELDSDSSDA